MLARNGPDTGNPPYRSWVLIALDWAGSLRSDFGDHGLVRVGQGLSVNARATDLHLHADGTIDVAFVDETRRITRIERRFPDGSPDEGFARGGRMHLAVPDRTSPRDLVLTFDRLRRMYVLATVEVQGAYGRLLVRRFITS